MVIRVFAGNSAGGLTNGVRLVLICFAFEHAMFRNRDSWLLDCKSFGNAPSSISGVCLNSWLQIVCRFNHFDKLGS